MSRKARNSSFSAMRWQGMSPATILLKMDAISAAGNFEDLERDDAGRHLHLGDVANGFAQQAFAPYRGAEIQPGAEAQSDADLDAFIRDHVESAYHPCGTCRMGRADDPLAVVDPQGRVIGVGALRVADSSVFPRIPNGNLNAPSIMVGEKIADHLLGRSLPPENAVPWVHPDWRNRQR